jgi:hypothetical protein
MSAFKSSSSIHLKIEDCASLVFTRFWLIEGAPVYVTVLTLKVLKMQLLQ